MNKMITELVNAKRQYDNAMNEGKGQQMRRTALINLFLNYADELIEAASERDDLLVQLSQCAEREAELKKQIDEADTVSASQKSKHKK